MHPATSGKRLIHIDPRTKFFLLFVIGAVIFIDTSKMREIIIFSALSGIMLLEQQYRTTLNYSLMFSVMMLIDAYVAPYLTGALGALILTMVRIPRLLMPLFLCSIILIRTTTVSEFIAAFRKMHITDKLIIPFSVMFRFIPTVKEEWHSISNAMRFRGIGVSAGNILTHPLITLEYVMVPLLMSTATISGELAAASLSRGLDTEGKRSCITVVRLGAVDYSIILALIALLILTLVR